MKSITANRLADGVVVYLDPDNQWTPHLREAARFEEEDAQNSLAALSGRTGEFADLYLMDVTDDGEPTGRAQLRERIRQAGPTVRPDLARADIEAR